MDFLGRILGKDGPENLVLTGKIEGRRDRGGQRKTFVGSLKEYIGAGIRRCEVLHISRNRGIWNANAANAARHGT